METKAGKREEGTLECRGECLLADEGQKENINNSSANNDCLRTSSQRLHGMYVKGFVENMCVNWLVDTGAAKCILSRDIAKQLFDDSTTYYYMCEGQSRDIFLANGKKIDIHGSSLITVTIGKQVFQVNVLIADITGEAILGMDALSQVNAVVDFIQGSLSVNGEPVDCIDYDRQPLSCRCLMCRMTVVPPNSEAVINGHLRHRKQSYCHETLTSNLRIMEPSKNPHLLGKGLCIARTLVDIEMSIPVPIRVLNLTDEPQIITANTTIARAKPVQSVQDFALSGNCNDDNINTDYDAQGDLPEPLRDTLSRSTTYRRDEEERQVTQLLIKYKHVFFLSDGDVGRTSLLDHRINPGNEAPIRQAPRRTPPWKQAEVERQVNT